MINKKPYKKHKAQDNLITFFYLLGRDEMSLGRIEGLIMKCEEAMKKDGTPKKNIFSNGHLAKWAEDTARRLRK